MVDTKAAYVETLRSGKTKYQAFDRTPSVVRVYGETAVVTGTATLQPAGPGGPVHVALYPGLCDAGGQWRMVAWQSTRLP